MISPREYSRFFRTLYNGTYLSHDLSEQTLDLLSKTNFTQGLVAGIPKDIAVSHKFGEQTINIVNLNNQQVIRELHDCGIVYLPNNPYLICIMTKGIDFINLQTVIKDISKISWDSFTSLSKKQ